MNPLAGSFRERLPRGPASSRCIAYADLLESSFSALLMDVWQLPHDGTHSSFVPPMDRGNTWSSCSSVLILPHQKHPAWVPGSAIFSSVSQFRFIWTHGRQTGNRPSAPIPQLWRPRPHPVTPKPGAPGSPGARIVYNQELSCARRGGRRSQHSYGEIRVHTSDPVAPRDDHQAQQ